MSGGRRIDDHSSWIGKGSHGTVFPSGAKMKMESDDGHDGHLSEYEDTTEAIKKQQTISKEKVKSHPMKSHYRN